MEESGALSPSMLVPLRLLTSGYYGGDSSLRRQMAVVAPATTAITTASTSGFKLPEGWAVEQVLRSDASRFDKYYYEPGSGQKFRSLKAVERYITGVEYTPSCKALKVGNHVGSSGPRKMIISGGMLLRLDKEEFDQNQLAVVAPTIAAATSPFNLPDGWVVEEVRRRSTRRCNGYTHKNYYEPGTGRKFRSLISVKRYLAKKGDNTPLSQVYKLGSHVMNSGSQKKISGEKVKTSTFGSARPPVKISWVLADPGGGTWNPFMGQSMVPESVKLQWAERFMLSINDENSAAPNIEYQS